MSKESKPVQGSLLHTEIDFVHEAAARWFYTIESGTATGQEYAAFQRWLDTSEQNRLAFREMEILWLELGSYEKELRRRYYSGVTGDETHPETGSPAYTPADNTKRKKIPVYYSLLSRAAIILLIIAFSLLFLTHYFILPDSEQNYSTGIAELASINLEDGSQIHMNADTKLVTSFGDKVRKVELMEGQAYFEVAEEKARPFVVEAGNAVIEAVGTAFDINRIGRQIKVTVIKGEVRISSIGLPFVGNSHWSVYALAEEQVVYDKDSFTKIMLGDNVSQTTTWRNGKLVFDNVPVPEIIVQFNRFNTTNISITDERVSSVRLSGSFQANDQEALLKALQWVADLDVIRVSDTDIRLQKKFDEKNNN